MDPYAQGVHLVKTGKGPASSVQVGCPAAFCLELGTDSDTPLDTPHGKAALLEAKKRALTEEVFVEQSMLKAPDSFDKLMELVAGKAPASLFRLVNVDQSWIDSMIRNVTTAEHMQRLFDVFRDHDMSYKVKVIFCLKKLWESRVFEQFLNNILEHSFTDIRAVMDLYHVAVILSFEVPNLTTAPADIFPYGSTAQHWLETHCGAGVEGCVRSILCSYYIRIIHNIFSMNNVSNLHHIKPILSKYNVMHQARVADTDGGVAKVVDEVIFGLLCNAKAAACGLAVFVIVQLLSTKNPRLEQFVRNHDFVAPLQDVSRHIVFSHTRWACSHLMKMLLSPPNLLEHTLPCFGTWYQEACMSGSFDCRHIRFRFPFEFAHVLLKDGMERGPGGSGKPVEQWASPLRHSYALRAVVDGIMSHSADRELRALSVLKLLLTTKWTTKRDVSALVSSPKYSQLPVKVMSPSHSGGSASDVAAESTPVNERKAMQGSNTLRERLKRGPSFFGKKSDSHKTLQRKCLTSSIDSQGSSSLMHLPEKILLRILAEVEISDLFTCCCVCWRMLQIIDFPANMLWQKALARDSPSSMHAPDDKHKRHEEVVPGKNQCKAVVRGMLPMAIYRVISLRFSQIKRSDGGSSTVSADAAQAVNNEIIVTSLKILGTMQRTPMWWPDLDPFMESHWAELLLKLAYYPDSLEVSKSAWRVVYQVLAYHPGMLDRFIEAQFLERFLKPLDIRAPSVVIFNGLYYLTKWLANDSVSADHRKRMARKDVQTLAQWLKDHDIWKQWHVLYNAYQTDVRAHSFIFPAIACLFSTVHDSFLCKKLKTSLFKTQDYRNAMQSVRDLARGKTTPPKDNNHDEDHAVVAKPKSEGLSYDGADELAPKPISRGMARSTGKMSEKREVTASGVKVVRDCGRHGFRPIDIEDGVALIRRNSDPGPSENLAVSQTDLARRASTGGIN